MFIKELLMLQEDTTADVDDVMVGLGYKLKSSEAFSGGRKYWYRHIDKRVSVEQIVAALKKLDSSLKINSHFDQEARGKLLTVEQQPPEDGGYIYIVVYKQGKSGDRARSNYDAGLDHDY